MMDICVIHCQCLCVSGTSVDWFDVVVACPWSTASPWYNQ